MARGPPRHKGHFPRSWWRVRRGCFKGSAYRHPGRRSLASHGKRERGVPDRRPQIHAADPCHDRSDDNHPDLLTCAERLQYEGYLRREEINAAILALARNGVAIKQIVRKTGHSRQLVRHVLRGVHGDVFRTRQSSLDAYLTRLDAQWTDGCRNSAELWRRLRSEGFGGSLRVVSEWATRRRRAEKASDLQLQKVPSARTIARLMTIARDHLSKADTVTIAAIEAGVPTLVDARKLIDRFHAMVRKRIEADLDPWIEAASQSLVASFASGVSNDKASVHAALVQPWSNGQTEDQINKLKLVKRQMYGRAKIDLLQARLIGAS